MFRLTAVFAIVFSLLSACAQIPDSAPVLDSNGVALPRAYSINPNDTARIQFRMLDAVNALRRQAGVGEVSLNSQLTAAAATHARDMSVQNRPWHFGSDGSSPIDRARRAGYTGQLRGETISETFETELETLGAWMEEEATRNVVLDPLAQDMGFAWFQEEGRKIWWTMVLGAPNIAPQNTVEVTPADADAPNGTSDDVLEVVFETFSE